jgi:hypothetical protein
MQSRNIIQVESFIYLEYFHKLLNQGLKLKCRISHTSEPGIALKIQGLVSSVTLKVRCSRRTVF